MAEVQSVKIGITEVVERSDVVVAGIHPLQVVVGKVEGCQVVLFDIKCLELLHVIVVELLELVRTDVQEVEGWQPVVAKVDQKIVFEVQNNQCTGR